MKLKILLFSLLLSTNILAEIPEDFPNQVRHLLQRNLQEKKYVGLSISVVTPNKTFTFHSGAKDSQTNITPDNDTVYEIASISKTFTRLLFANQNEILLNDIIDNYLPSTIQAPRPNGKSITFENLITHTGILLSVPCAYRSNQESPICFGFDLSSVTNPYKETTREGLFQFINEYASTVVEFPFQDPGLFYNYSNVGTGLLGEILAEKNSTNYEDLVQGQIFNVLGMKSSHIKTICSPPLLCPDLTRVYYKENISDEWQEGSHWEMPGMAGAGGIRSTLNDMILYLKANMGLHSTSLDSSIKVGQSYLRVASDRANSNLCQPGQNPQENLCNEVQMNFYHSWEGLSPGTIFYHAGATAASQSMMLFSQDKSIGIVILSNSSVRDGSGNPRVHYPNNLALCLMQMAKKPIAEVDFCQTL